MTAYSPDDLAAIEEQGDLASFFAALIGKPMPQPAAAVEDEPPSYHIARPGAWPCGTSATGPVPGPYCPECQPSETAPTTPPPAESRSAA